MSQNMYLYDDIKRKLRRLKKFEIKVRSTSYGLVKTSVVPFGSTEQEELIWNRFFDLKNASSNKVKYSLNRLSAMTKEELKGVVSEFFSYVYYCYEDRASDHSLMDTELLTELGLPLYAEPEEIKKKLRELAKKYHPDNGGDSAKFIELMNQYKRFKN